MRVPGPGSLRSSMPEMMASAATASTHRSLALDARALLDVERHDVARHQQQRLDLGLAQHAFGPGRRADLDLVEGNVAVAAHCEMSIHVVLSSVYLSKACSDLSRPVPDCLKPPNGTVMSSAS